MEKTMSSPLSTVVQFEFTRQVKKPSFWATILLVPLMIVAIFLISFFSAQRDDTLPTLDENISVAITDDAHILPADSPFLANITKEDGIQQVVGGETELYFYIPADFSKTKKIDFYHISEDLDVFNSDSQLIKAILSQAVAPHFSDLEITALTGAFDITDNKLTPSGEASNAIGKAIIPITILVIFFFFVVLFSGRLLMTVVEEKENRISEMLLTSISARHLIVGKILSMLLLGLVQICVLIIPVAILVFIFRDQPMINGLLSSIVLDPVTIISNLILLFFSIFLVTGMLTYVGTIISNAKDASQFIGPVIIGVVFPLYFLQAFLASNPSTIVYFLTYFPLTAPTALMLRSAFGTISAPEFIIGLIEIIILAIVTTRITIKSFQKNAINFGTALPSFLKRRKS